MGLVCVSVSKGLHRAAGLVVWQISVRPLSSFIFVTILHSACTHKGHMPHAQELYQPLSPPYFSYARTPASPPPQITRLTKRGSATAWAPEPVAAAAAGASAPGTTGKHVEPGAPRPAGSLSALQAMEEKRDKAPVMEETRDRTEFREAARSSAILWSSSAFARASASSMASLRS